MKLIPEVLKKDSWGLGIAAGIIVPLVVFGLLTLINLITEKSFGHALLVKGSTVQLISIFINLFTLRYYLLKLQFDKTGRGILLVTFVFAISFFIFNMN